jgi:hypothetical protein
MARIFFEFCKTAKQRATMPFHLFLEEAHRYVNKDSDVYLIGYNIFERIAKEGRKYGVLLNIISQRPVEISETVIAQCSNFLIFKMTHPKDIEYIRTMLPNISQDVIEKQKVLQPGNCVGFGQAFKLAMVIKMEMPNPAPNSNSCNVNKCWGIELNEGAELEVPIEKPNLMEEKKLPTAFVSQQMADRLNASNQGLQNGQPLNLSDIMSSTNMNGSVIAEQVTPDTNNNVFFSNQAEAPVENANNMVSETLEQDELVTAAQQQTIAPTNIIQDINNNN